MVKNIVLVHGAIVDASSWAKVILLLEAQGLNVTAVQNPLTSLVDDVAATIRTLGFAGRAGAASGPLLGRHGDNGGR